MAGGKQRVNLHVRGLVLVFILKDLPIGAVQTILFFELANQK